MSISILGVKLDNLSEGQLTEQVEKILKSFKQNHIATPNPEIVLIAQKDGEYKKILNNAIISLPDGIGLKFAGWWLNHTDLNRITGVDFINLLAKIAEQKKYSVGLIGGMPGVAVEAEKNLTKLFPQLKISALGNSGNVNLLGVGNKDEEIKNFINKNQFQILIVAFGAPKQEKWINKNLTEFPSVKLAVGVGGALDYISGKINRAPKLIQIIGLEWLWRLIHEPWRWKRIWRACVVFPITVVFSRKQT